MIKNWPTFLQNNSRPPETVDEAISRLLVILDGEQKTVLAVMQEEDLIDLHFSLGLAIRNAFRLHDSDSKLKASLGPLTHADDVSEEIIRILWMKLLEKV